MFRSLLSPRSILLAALCTAFAFAALGQDGPPPERDGRGNNDRRPDLLAQLGLSPEQVKQFRRLNMRHRPLIKEAQERLGDANRELDMAIYADNVLEEDVRAKLRAFHEAQAEVNRLRFVHELNIRKLLTLEQLVRFRDMRRRFVESRQDNRRQLLRPGPGANPDQRRLLEQKRPVT